MPKEPLVVFTETLIWMKPTDLAPDHRMVVLIKTGLDRVFPVIYSSFSGGSYIDTEAQVVALERIVAWAEFPTGPIWDDPELLTEIAQIEVEGLEPEELN